MRLVVNQGSVSENSLLLYMKAFAWGIPPLQQMLVSSVQTLIPASHAHKGYDYLSCRKLFPYLVPNPI